MEPQSQFPMAEASPSKPSILLLEDDNALAEMIATALGGEFEIERAANVEEAGLLLGSRPFQLLLCDHMMPGGKQGLDFLVEAQERFPKAKRILMTGYMNPDFLSRSGFIRHALNPATAMLRESKSGFM